MEDTFEPVHEVADYLDRPLKGVADFGGVPHRFCHVGWASPPLGVAASWEALEPWLLEYWGSEQDRYELVPAAAPDGPATWVRALFSGTQPGLDVPADTTAIRVCWKPVPIRERLDHILEAQRWSAWVAELDTPAYLCIGLYLQPADLEQVRPDLRPRDPELPDLGDLGRYRGVPVFTAGDRCRPRGECAFFQGVWFAYVPMLAVD